MEAGGAKVSAAMGGEQVESQARPRFLVQSGVERQPGRQDKKAGDTEQVPGERKKPGAV